MTTANSDIINIIKERLINAYNPKTIYLFGSHAWGKPDVHSDFDLLVIIEKSDEKPYKRIRKGIDALTGLCIAKDILVYTINEFERRAGDISTLCYKIKKEGIKLYEAL
ncbi:MAG: nucleotidyltransferase domain-containing protein [Bacteroidetes bacterium]|nr:nucleotidyltransferase domain-containing protein [Bacteroidota bacterium]